MRELRLLFCVCWTEYKRRIDKGIDKKKKSRPVSGRTRNKKEKEKKKKNILLLV